ncbi:AAA family ATPase [Fodinibacter luteus]|uniref:AAA family ATPase n=1 Tax=Fodinibacter luteus TaxID=552064 RepID=A0ABP8K9C4_9MICO
MSHPPLERHRPVEHADPDHVAAVTAAARAARPVAGGPVVVAVDGRSGSGKTLLGTAVARELGCPVVHVDAVYPGWDGLSAGVALVTEHVLEPLARGERASYPRWDWMRSRPGRTVAVPPGTHLVLEGCGSLVPPAVAHAAVRVWVEAPEDLRRQRALGRDGDTYAPHWDRWAAQEDAVYAASRPWLTAHLVLRTAPA